MDWLISAKNRVKCLFCHGSGVVPYEGNKTAEYSIELSCRSCKGKGWKVKKMDLTIESLKELLKWIITVKEVFIIGKGNRI